MLSFDFIKLKGISRRIAVSFSILILFVLIFLLTAIYFIMQNSVQSINRSYIIAGLEHKNEKLGNFIEEINSFSKRVLENDDVQKLYEGTGFDSAKIDKFMNDIIYNIYNSIEGVYFVTNEKKIYEEVPSQIDDYIKANINDIVNKAKDSQGEMVFINTKYINYGQLSRGDNFFIMVRKVRSRTRFFKDIGFIVIPIRENQAWMSISKSADIGDFYVTTLQGDIISCKNKKLIGKDINGMYKNILLKAFNGDDNSSYVTGGYVVNAVSTDKTKWKLINVVPINELNSNYYNIQKLILIIAVFGILVSIYLSILISRRIAKPIKGLISSMKMVAKGNLDVRIEEKDEENAADELKELNYVFNNMTKKLENLVQEVYIERLKEKDAKLKALTAQINPHFLYNTLDTIYWMLIVDYKYDTAELVTKLSEILRYSIKHGNSKVKVREEVHQIENYLYIQKSRFKENLEYELQVDSSIMDFDILSFVLQPFVENAVNHGIMDTKGAGKVVIKGFQQDGTIVFEIWDNGSGISLKKIEDLLKNKVEENPGNGIGVANVNDRIKSYYGEEYGINIESVIDGYTNIIIRIPIITGG